MDNVWAFYILYGLFWLFAGLFLWRFAVCYESTFPQPIETDEDDGVMWEE